MAIFTSKMGLVCLVITIGLLAISVTEAREHLVGGKADAWKVPSSDPQSLTKWASNDRFLIGDNLVWKYSNKQDSVLEVTRDAYFACNTTNPIAEHKNDGAETKVVLKNSGPHYFISGLKENCDKGEKVLVVVISPHSRPSGGVTASPSPAPAPESGIEPNAVSPAVAPTSGSVGIKGGVLVVVGLFVGFLLM